MTTKLPDETRGYVERSLELHALDAQLEAGGPPLAVTGPAGCGKSTLLAGWVRRLAERSPSLPLVWHSAEESFESAEVMELAEAVGRSACEELSAHELGYDQVRHCDSDCMPGLCLPDLTSGELVVVIDGLDYVHHGNRPVDLSWLPLELPSAIRLIVSVSDPRWRGVLQERGWKVHEVPSFNMSERNQLVCSWLAAKDDPARAALSERVGGCAELPWAGNPLCLVQSLAAVEETGEPISAGSYAELISQRLDNWERQSRGHVERSLGPLLAISRIGCHPVFVHALTGRTQNAFGRLRSRATLQRLEPIIVERADFFHPANGEVRAVLRERYLATEQQREQAHRLAARATAGAVDIPVVCEEHAFHLHAAQQWDELARFLSEHETFSRLRYWDSDGLGYYWRSLEGRHDAVECYRRSLAHLEHAEPRTSMVPASNNVALFFKDSLGRPGAAEALYRRSIELGDRLLGPSSANSATARANLASLLTDRPGGEKEAAVLYQRVLEAHQQSERVAEGYPSESLVLCFYGDLPTRVEKVEQAAECKQRALELAESAYGPEHPAAASRLISYARVIQQAKPKEAVQLTQRALEIRKAVFGRRDSSTAHAMRQLGIALEWCEEWNAAEQTYQRALECYRASPRRPRAAEAWCLRYIGDVHGARGNDEAAFRYWHEATSLLKKELGSKHCGYAGQLYSLAIENDCRDRVQQAAELYEESWRVRLEAFGEHDRRVGLGQLDLARLLAERGELVRAEQVAQEVLQADEAVLGRDHRYLGSDLLVLAEIRRRQGDVSAARDALLRAERIFARDEPDSRWAAGQIALGLVLAASNEWIPAQARHEAGMPLVNRSQRRYLRGVVTGYQELAERRNVSAWARREAARRAQQIDRVSRTERNRSCLASHPLSFRPLRAAWHPSRPLLAVGGCHGEVSVLQWHPEGSLLEEVRFLAAPNGLSCPDSEAAAAACCGLNWSDSGARLRVRDASGEARVIELGRSSRDEEHERWAPASPLTLDGSLVAQLRRTELRVVPTATPDA